MSAVTVDGLVKSYRDTTALSGVSFEVAEGEVLAVLGPNGAGKTSCLEILEGYRPRDAGRVEVLGVDPGHRRSGWRERIGVLLQTTSVEPDLTVHEALRLYTGFYRRPRPVAELLDLLDLTGVRNRRAGRLSGGQQRRLDLALAIAGRPRLLFLDEPTTGFDPQARRRTWDLVRELAADGVTVVLTTHYLEEAAQLADRVVVLVGGRIVAEGDPDSLGGADLSQSTVRYRRDSELVELRTPTPTAVLAELTGRAAAAGTELADLTVTRPTLEDVYLELTGAHTR